MLWCCCGKPTTIDVRHEITIDRRNEKWYANEYAENYSIFPAVTGAYDPLVGWASTWPSNPIFAPTDTRSTAPFYSLIATAPNGTPEVQPLFRHLLPFGGSVSALTMSESASTFNMLKVQPEDAFIGTWPLWNGTPTMKFEIWDGHWLRSSPVTDTPPNVLATLPIPATYITEKHWKFEPDWLALANLLCVLFTSSDDDYTVAMAPDWDNIQATPTQRTYRTIASNEGNTGGASGAGYEQQIFLESIQTE